MREKEKTHGRDQGKEFLKPIPLSAVIATMMLKRNEDMMEQHLKLAGTDVWKIRKFICWRSSLGLITWT